MIVKELELGLLNTFRDTYEQNPCDSINISITKKDSYYFCSICKEMKLYPKNGKKIKSILSEKHNITLICPECE